MFVALPELDLICLKICITLNSPFLADDLGRLVRAVGQAVAPLGGEAVAVELCGAPRRVDGGRGARAVRHGLRRIGSI